MPSEPPSVAVAAPPHVRVLVRREPGETDLTIFTAALPRVGRHRVDSRGEWLRVVREPASGSVVLRALLNVGAR
jgi:hypothetical protein